MDMSPRVDLSWPEIGPGEVLKPLPALVVFNAFNEAEDRCVGIELTLAMFDRRTNEPPYLAPVHKAYLDLLTEKIEDLTGDLVLRIHYAQKAPYTHPQVKGYVVAR